MNRRTVIKNLALVVGGAVLLPSCLHKDGTSYIELNHVKIDPDQQKLIGDICETIIPKTTTPGAKDLNLPSFVLKMLDDCYKKSDQEAFMAGLADFNETVEKKYNQPFGDLSAKDREAFLIEIEKNSKSKINNNNTPPGNLKPEKAPDIPPLDAFYTAIKQQTVFGYTTSQYFMTKQVVYELVPGRYNAHFAVKNLRTA